MLPSGLQVHLDGARPQRLEDCPLDPRHSFLVYRRLLLLLISLQRLRSIHMLDLPQPELQILKVLWLLRNVNAVLHQLVALILTFYVILGIRA